MPSFRAHLVSWYLWFFSKGNYTSVEALHKRIASARKSPSDYRPPQHLRVKFIIQERQVDGYPVIELAPKSETPDEARILYLHGGSFMFEIQPAHWTLIALLAERLQASVTVPIYPLGPEKKLKDMYAMLQPIHDDMARTAARDGSPFFVVGDSAGGCMSLVVTQEAIKAGTPVSTGLVPITPVVDATFTNLEAHEVSKKDPWLDVVGCKEVGELVRGEWPIDDARVSPLFGDVDELPPMMILAAEMDLLTPDTKRFVQKAQAAGKDVTVVEGPGMMHVWPLALPDHDGKKATDDMVDWMEEKKKKSSSST